MEGIADPMIAILVAFVETGSPGTDLPFSCEKYMEKGF